MATVQISKQQLDEVNQFLSKSNNKRFTKKSTVSRAVNIFYDHLNTEVLNEEYNDLSIVSIDEINLKQLRRAKEKYNKPMYVLASACVKSYFDSVNGLETANIALVKFKARKKIYAFYFDSDKLNVQHGDTVEVRTKKYYNDEMMMLEGQVVAIGYEENAENIHKPVLKITKHKKSRTE